MKVLHRSRASIVRIFTINLWPKSTSLGLHHLELLSFCNLFDFGLLTLVDEEIFILVAVLFQFSSGTLQRGLRFIFGVVSLLFESVNIFHFLVHYFLRFRIDLGHEGVCIFLLVDLLLDLHLFFIIVLVLDEEFEHRGKLSGVLLVFDEIIRPHEEPDLFPHLLVESRILLEYLQLFLLEGHRVYKDIMNSNEQDYQVP